MTDQISIPPAREILLEALPDNWKGKLKKLADHHEVPKAERDRVQEFLENKVYFNGIETYLPFFHDALSSLFDYLPGDTVLSFENEADLLVAQNLLLKETAEHQKKSVSLERVFATEEIFLTAAETTEYGGYFPKIDFVDFNADLALSMESNDFLKSSISLSHENALAPLVSLLDERRKGGTQIFLVASSPAQKERLLDLLARYQVPLKSVEQVEIDSPSPFVQVALGPLSGGFYLPQEKT